MTKHCFRILFLALAALPLAQAGCGDGSVECLGTAVACSNRDASECKHGCELRSGCVGDVPVTCDSLTDNPNVCVQTKGCRYVGTCDGAANCKNLKYDECGMTEGCMQVRRCIGDDFDCNRLEDSQCELYPQCKLGQQCVGSATSCGDLDSQNACIEVPGCYAADTKPSVVGRAD
jgi:hypothetical protein